MTVIDIQQLLIGIMTVVIGWQLTDLYRRKKLTKAAYWAAMSAVLHGIAFVVVLVYRRQALGITAPSVPMTIWSIYWRVHALSIVLGILLAYQLEIRHRG